MSPFSGRRTPGNERPTRETSSRHSQSQSQASTSSHGQGDNSNQTNPHGFTTPLSTQSQIQNQTYGTVYAHLPCSRIDDEGHPYPMSTVYDRAYNCALNCMYSLYLPNDPNLPRHPGLNGFMVQVRCYANRPLTDPAQRSFVHDNLVAQCRTQLGNYQRMERQGGGFGSGEVASYRYGPASGAGGAAGGGAAGSAGGAGQAPRYESYEGHGHGQQRRH
ncbi:hypothetical protein P170DRAFT_426251 [Aspergillus steynii IBT 23096]|uniref:Uncharacterized protein n=1 Tax=Aspergillus steynii IBT 23096 TaxID=1392250 RepID=A0A2I2G8V0_9EURO|nr:uncharacterized protein P170DRAFT_426251 [Aspergillus steynii IBT 23096]PLB49312.1 hypothetical protein P170DRAFT_426251 [Aspergillus steynii IBT 23096]